MAAAVQVMSSTLAAGAPVTIPPAGRDVSAVSGSVSPGGNVSHLDGLVAKVVTRIKGDGYQVDPRISGAALLSVSWTRVLMKVRGAVRFPARSARPFVGSGVRIRHGSRISFGRGVTFGDGSRVDALSVDGVRLGDNVAIGRNTRIECTGSLRTLGVGIVVGNDVGLGTDSFYGCAGGITVGSDTIVGNYVSFHSENHNASRADLPIRLQGESHQGIVVGANCWFGARCTVLDGVTIEDGCVFAAGSVVTAGRYAADGIYGGVPARLLKSRLQQTPGSQIEA
jgi:acetyltransferase-like isoleucine patch superfamily enzyme